MAQGEARWVMVYVAFMCDKGSGPQLNFTAPNLFTPFVSVVPPIPQGFPAVVTRLALRAWCWVSARQAARRATPRLIDRRASCDPRKEQHQALRAMSRHKS